MTATSIFPPMIEVVPEGKQGVAAVDHFDVSREASRFSSLRSGDYVPAGRYCRLSVLGQVMMSDTYRERATNYEVVRRAHGRVLIAGLGLGMILIPILAKPEVESVLVVEMWQDVIDLVAPRFLDPTLTVKRGDIYEWRPMKGEMFNTIYFDIWGSVSTDVLQSMAKLHRAFWRYLDRTDPNRWMDSWDRDGLRARKRRERTYGGWR